MTVSTFDLFSIGIGPSSSHTVGPMRAARLFAIYIQEAGVAASTSRVVVDLYGSLALTGIGHGTPIAVLLGLEGYTPDGIDPDKVPQLIGEIRQQGILRLFGAKEISFHEESDLLFHCDRQLPFHPNGIRFSAYTASGELLIERVYYSIGGGFVLVHGQEAQGPAAVEAPYPFTTAATLLELCRSHDLTIAELMLANEKAHRTEAEIRCGLLRIWDVMLRCMERGCATEGILPGGLGVKRRAAGIYRNLIEERQSGSKSPTTISDWVSTWALAVNEENAAGGRVVTAPTNGSAGVIPSVLHYYVDFHAGDDDGIIRFFLTAAAIGILYKAGASISAAEMGCMGEVGVACSMAAAGLTAALGGSIEQIENAAEIGMEHHLGLTCDPVGGLVQIPCIERNTMGANSAINASSLALHGDGTHRVTLDQVIATMRQTGRDMQTIYKETSLGGLAVNVPEC